MRTLAVLGSIAPLALFLVACSGGGSGGISPTAAGEESPGVVFEPSSRGGAESSSSSGDQSNGQTSNPQPTTSGGLGPNCTKFLDCCDRAAAKIDSLKPTCASARQSFTAQGAAAESTCAQQYDAAKSQCQ